MKNQRKWLKKQKIHIGTGNSYAPTNLIHDILHQPILRTKFQCRTEQLSKILSNNQRGKAINRR